MSDALNTQKSVTDAILKNGADYLLPIRKNSKKELVNHIEAIFNREHKKCVKDHSLQKDHGCIDEWFFEILPAAPFLDKRIKDQHSKVRSLVKYTKVSVKITDDIEGKRTEHTRYYISSLPYNENTIHQVRASVEDYWAIETHHAVLDDPGILNQDHLHLCNTNSISNAVGFNKTSHSFLSYMRQMITKSLGFTKPVSFKTTAREMCEMNVFDYAKKAGRVLVRQSRASSRIKSKQS